MSLFLLLLAATWSVSAIPEAERLARLLEADRLTRETQQAFLESGSHLVVFYYLEEFKPLQAFAKGYSKVKEKLAASWPQLRLAYIDASRDLELLEDLNLEELPLVQVILHGIVVTFNSPDGSMDFSALPEFVDRFMTATCTPLAGRDARAEAPVNFEAYYFSKGRPEADELMRVLCVKYEDSARIFQVADQSRMAEIARGFGYEIEVADFLLLGHRKHDQQSFLFESRVQAAELMHFIDNSLFPLASHLTENTLRWAVQDRLELLVFFYQNAELVEGQVDELQKWVQEMNDASMLLCLANMNEDFVKEFAASHGIDSSAFSLFIVKPFVSGMPKYRFGPGSISPASVSDFWAAYKAKSLKRFYKSEKPSELPEAPGLVAVASAEQAAVGSDFQQRVLDNQDHHCLVLFHDDGMHRLVEEFRAAVEHLRIQSVRFFRFNTQRNENAFVEPAFRGKLLLFRRLDDQVPELPVGADMSSQLLLEFLRDHLSE